MSAKPRTKDEKVAWRAWAQKHGTGKRRPGPFGFGRDSQEARVWRR